VPKQRYKVMKRFLPERGARGLDMMRRTATVQANFDYSSEADAMLKMSVLLRLSPIVQAMTANAPFLEGRVSSRKSERGDVWLHMDPARSGTIPALWKANATYRDYTEWALDAGMFLFRRGDEFILNTGQTFRSFLADGYQGHRATLSDWALHLNTLFPEARLKRTIEARSCDSLPLSLAHAVPALFTGLLYDAESLSAAAELAETIGHGDLEAARPDLVTNGVDASVGGRPVRAFAERIFELSVAGLRRRARRDAAGRDESVHLAPLGVLVEAGRCPADVLREGLAPGTAVDRAELVRRTRL
jgi:glutamate--cysteine ligase